MNSFITKFIGYVYINDINEDEKFICYNMEFDLAKSILQEFGDTSAMKIAKILLGACEDWIRI